MKKKDIDKIDIEILNQLSTDAYLTNKELATKLNLSGSPTLARVKALIRKEVIKKQVAVVNKEYLGYKTQIYFVVTVLNDSLEDIIERIKVFPFVTCINSISSTDLLKGTNSTSLLVVMYDKQGEYLSKFLSCMSEHKQGVVSIKHHPVQKVYKDEELKFNVDDIK